MSSRKLTLTVVLLLVAALGLAAYLLHMKHGVERSAAATPRDVGSIAEPVAGKPESVTLFQASDDEGALHGSAAVLIVPGERGRRAREILRALIAQYQQASSTHPIGAGARVREVYLVKDNLAVVDVNEEFADSHRSGILVEELTLASMAQTLAANLPGVTHMKLLVDGKERATLAGHADLVEPYEAAAAVPLIKQR
jgi:hypothetical protein